MLSSFFGVMYITQGSILFRCLEPFACVNFVRLPVNRSDLGEFDYSRLLTT